MLNKKMLKWTVVMMLLLYSCKVSNKLEKAEEDLNTYEEMTIEGLKLPSQPFSFLVNKRNLMENSGKKVEETFMMVNNRWDKTKRDTIFNYSICKNKIQVYSKGSTNIILDATIQDDCIVLRDGIKVGLKKEEMIGIIPQLKNASSDKITISDESGFSSVYFLFKKEKLAKIVIIANINY